MELELTIHNTTQSSRAAKPLSIPMDITVMTRQIIKPSSPTPPHFKYLKLSLVDQQIHSTAQLRMLFFYSSQGDPHRFENSNMSERLKRSLSQVLTEYYPLAGRLHDTQTIDCNDHGLEYIEARVKAPLTLNHLVTHPTPEEHDPLLPHDVYNYGKGFKGLSAVQVTFFDACGGMAIGISISHLLGDGSMLATFVNKWADIARGKGMPADDIAVEKFTFSSLFPPRDMPAADIVPEDFATARKLSTKRFVFPQSKIDLLKKEFEYQSPTRVEAIAALIFSRLIDISKKLSKPIFPGIAIDLRGRMHQCLPKGYLGNMSVLSLMQNTSPEMSMNDRGVQLRRMIREIDGDYIDKLQADNASLFFERQMLFTEFCMNNDVGRMIALSSCCNFPFHKVDFGWGVPAMTAPVLHSYPSVFLLSQNDGDGIVAWLTLDEDDMTYFQSDTHILQFVQAL